MSEVPLRDSAFAEQGKPHPKQGQV